MRREVNRWLSDALWDLDTAALLHRNGRHNAACFYAQQAAEKAAKALLYPINQAPWGHSVRLPLERYAQLSSDSEAAGLIPLARDLDRHYIPSRYPNAHPEGTSHEAYDEDTSKEAIIRAEKIISFVNQRLGRKVVR